jgi:hypothetical protein
LIAEKVQAMVKLGELNSRMKDFHDIRHLSQQGSFRQDVLAQAIAKTFAARKTPIPTVLVIGQMEYIEAHTAMWRAFLGKQADRTTPDDFQVIAQELVAFLMPVLLNLNSGRKSEAVWNPASRAWEQKTS